MLPIETAIIERLRSGPCCFDDLVTDLPRFTWGDMFVAVDDMSRDGRVFVRLLGYSTFEISLGWGPTAFSSSLNEMGMQGSLSV